MKIIIIASMCLSLFCFGAFSQTIKTDTIKVWGNCETCKRTIENALDVKGVKRANWNKDTKKLVISYDTVKVSMDKIQHLIAAAGYDTEKVKGDDKAYNNLPNCCKYNRKE
jgi:mercuric ion binding protein